MTLTCKLVALSFIPTLLHLTSTGQVIGDTSIITKSPTIDLKYSPTGPVSKTTMTFLKLKNDYGIQFSFMTPGKNMTHIYIESVDSFMLGLSSNKQLVLKRHYRDTIYTRPDGTYFWQIIYLLDKSQFDELRHNKIVTLFVTHGSRPLELLLRRKSQSKICATASSF